MIKDKKNFNSKLNLILLEKIGKTIKPGKYLTSIEKVRKFLNFKLSR